MTRGIFCAVAHCTITDTSSGKICDVIMHKLHLILKQSAIQDWGNRLFSVNMDFSLSEFFLAVL